MVEPLSRPGIHDELEQARAEFHRLVRDCVRGDLREPPTGTRWTNQQLLFHMLFGYLIVRALLPLVRIHGSAT